MRQASRWLAAGLATGAVFAFSTVIFQTLAFPWLIKDSGVRWGVAGAGGAAVAAIVVAWGAGFAAKERADEGAREETSPPGGPIIQWNPLDLGVHRGIDPGEGWQADDLPVLPPYIPRAHDSELCHLLAHSGHRVMAVLVGGSSTGKTRACYEAVRAVPELADWQVIHPADGAELDTLLSRPLPAESVLWLNETQVYLDGEHGPSAAAHLRRLLTDDRQQVIVLGSMSREYWRDFIAPPGSGVLGLGADGKLDRYAQARELLGMSRARRIDVPDDFSEISTTDLESLTTQDPRLAAAERVAGPGRKITQLLAGGQMLADQYPHILDPRARAVITAAMDARRLGHRGLFPGPLLEHAAPGYLTAAQRVADDTWFSQAVAATEVLRGIRGLEPHRSPADPGPPDSYDLHPYLEEYARKTRRAKPLPAETWEALAAYASVDDRSYDRVALAAAAEIRGLYQTAVSLATPAAQAGNVIAMCLLANRFHDAGDHHETEAGRWLRRATAAGSIWAGELLLKWRQPTGWDDDVEEIYREAAGRGHAWFIAQLVIRLQDTGRDREAGERLERLRQAAEADDPVAIEWWAAWLRRTRSAESETWLLHSANVGNPGAIAEISALGIRESGNPAVEQALRHAAGLGDPLALRTLRDLLCREGREPETEQVWRDAASKGSTYAMRMVAARLQRVGHHDDAVRWLHRAADAGDATAMCLLAGWLARDRRDEDTMLWLRQAAENNESAALDLYALWIAAGEDRETARAALTAVARTGSTDIPLRTRALSWPADGQWLRHLAEAGSTSALKIAAFNMEQAGEHDELEQWLRQLLEAGVPDPIASNVALGLLLQTRGRHKEAVRLHRFGILPGGRTADPW